MTNLEDALKLTVEVSETCMTIEDDDAALDSPLCNNITVQVTYNVHQGAISLRDRRLEINTV